MAEQYEEYRQNSPYFRALFEEHKFLKQRIKEFENKRGYLSYDEVKDLEVMKKMKLVKKDEMADYIRKAKH